MPISARSRPILGEFPMMIWHVNEDWAKTHQKELLAFIRAHNKAVRYMSDPAHRQEVSQMLADASKSKLDDALKTWDLCMKVKAFVADGGISDSATERVRDTLVATGDIKRRRRPRTYVDHASPSSGEVVGFERCSKTCSASTARSRSSPAPATASAAPSRSGLPRSAPP